jgi:hypothetical protein
MPESIFSTAAMPSDVGAVSKVNEDYSKVHRPAGVCKLANDSSKQSALLFLGKDYWQVLSLPSIVSMSTSLSSVSVSSSALCALLLVTL